MNQLKSKLPFIWEVRRAEAERILLELLAGEFSDVGRKWNVLITPWFLERGTQAEVKFIRGLKFAIVRLQGHNWEKEFPNLATIKGVIMHELLHLRFPGCGHLSEPFYSERFRLKIG